MLEHDNSEIKDLIKIKFEDLTAKQYDKMLSLLANLDFKQTVYKSLIDRIHQATQLE